MILSTSRKSVVPKNLYLQLVPSDLLKFLAYVAGAVGGNENWSSVLSDLQTYTARKIIQNTREDDVHSAKKFLDTSVKLSRAKSPIFLEIFCIRYIKIRRNKRMPPLFWYQICRNRMRSSHLNKDKYRLKNCKCYHSTCTQIAYEYALFAVFENVSKMI